MTTEKEAMALLKKYAPSQNAYEKVLAHSKTVQKIALRIAKKVSKADVGFIKIASLLHDIGRFKYGPGEKRIVRHGVEGARMLAKEGLDKRFGNVCERHLGCGINKKDIKEQKLPLPDKCYVPLTVNEKIISYADNLVFGDREGTIKQVIERYKNEFGEKYAERFNKQHEEIIKLIREKN